MSAVLERFKKKLIELEVHTACKEIGLTFETVFLEGLENKDSNPYDEYEWVVMPHSLISIGRVIHAIPPISRSDKMPWEEWFLLNGKLHHNVLYTKEHEKCDSEFSGSPDDNDHPKKVLQRKWYYYTHPSLLPLLFSATILFC